MRACVCVCVHVCVHKIVLSVWYMYCVCTCAQYTHPQIHVYWTHLFHVHVEPDADDEEVLLLLTDGHQLLVRVAHCLDLLSDH